MKGLEKLTTRRFIYLFLFLILPLFFIFNILKTSQIDVQSKRFIENYLRRTLQAKVEIQGLQWSPQSNSVRIKELKLNNEDFLVTSSKAEISLNPIKFISRNFTNTSVEIDEIHFTLKKDLFSYFPDKATDEKKDPLSLIQEYRETLNTLLKKLGKQKISFKKIRVNKIQLSDPTRKILLENIHIDKNSFEINSSLNMAILNKEEKTSQSALDLKIPLNTTTPMAIRNFETKASKSFFQSKGEVPGSLNYSSKLSQTDITNNLKALKIESQELSTNEFSTLEGNGSIEVLKNGQLQLNSNLKINDFKNSFFQSKEIQGQITSTKNETLFENLKIKLNKNSLASKESTITISELSFLHEKNSLRGSLQAQNLHLCSLLSSFDIDECYLNPELNGNTKISGSLKPLKLNINSQHSTNAFDIFSSVYRNRTKKKPETLIKMKPLQLSTEAIFEGKEITLKSMKLSNNGSTIQGAGSIQTAPLLVQIKAQTKKFQLAHFIKDFLGLEIDAQANLQSEIIYDATLRKTQEFPHKITTQLKLNRTWIENVFMGDLEGPFIYDSIGLRAPEMKLNQNSSLNFSMLRKEKLSKIRIQAQLKRNPIAVYDSRKSQEKYFSSLLSGPLLMEHDTRKSRSEQKKFPNTLQFHNVEILDIPFASGVARLKNTFTGLFFDKYALNFKQKYFFGNGEISSQKIRMNFISEELKVQRLAAYFPQLESIESGSTRIKGSWHGSDQFEVQTLNRNLKINQQSIKNLKIDYSQLKNKKINIHSDFDSCVIQQEESQCTLSKELLNILTELYIPKPKGLKITFTNGLKTALSSNSLSIKSPQAKGLIQFLDKSEMPFELNGLNNFRYSENKAQIKDSIQFTFPKKLKTSLSQNTIQGKLPMKIFNIFLPEGLFFSNGTLSIQKQNFNINKLFENTLSAQMEGASLNISKISTPFKKLNAQLKLKNKTIFIDQKNGVDGNDHVKVSGQFSIHKTLKMKLNAVLKEAPFSFGEGLYFKGSGRIALKGDQAPYILSGDAKLDESKITSEFKSTNTSNSGLENFLNFDLNIDTNKNLNIYNSLLRGLVDGKLRITGNENNPLFQGSVEVIKGDILAKNNLFSIKNATAQLSIDEENKQNIILDIGAESIKEYSNTPYTINMNVSGNSESPTLSFNSDPYLQEKQIINLLSFGFIPNGDEYGTQGSSIAQNAGVEAFQILFGAALGQSIEKRTGFDVNVGSTSNIEQSEAIPKLTISRKFNERLSAEFGRSLDTSRPENNFKVDYKLRENMNLTGVWENPDENTHSLGVDIRFKIDIE